MRRLLALLPLLPLVSPGADAATASPPGGRWYATQFHAHSRHSDGVHDLATVIRWAKEGGLDALAVTDHQMDTHIADPAWQHAEGIVMIPAYEWTRGFWGHWDGGERPHISVWGVRPGETPVLPETLTRDEAVKRLHAQGLTIGANHPFEPRFPWPDADLTGVDAMEVWQWNYGKEPTAPPPAHARVPRNSMGEFAYRNAWAIDLWREQLAAGRMVTPLATADFHVVGAQRVESPCTLVWSEAATADGILAGVRAGRVALVAEPRGPRVTIEADADHDGVFEAMAGDRVPVGARLRFRAIGAKGLALGVWRADGPVSTRTLGGPAADVTLTAAEGAYFARLDQPGATWDRLRAMSGAIRVAKALPR